MSNDHRIFHIQSHDGEFRTGSLVDGTQVLLIPTSSSHTACLRFDASGTFLASEEIESADIIEADNRISITHNSSNMQVSAKSIAVKIFSAMNVGIQIRMRPETFESFLDDPVTFEPEAINRERTLRQIHDWDAEKRFVLATWGKDYWMNVNGSVFAT